SAFTIRVPVEAVRLEPEQFRYDCLLIVSVPGMADHHLYQTGMDCIAAIRSACGWSQREVWIDREVFGDMFLGSDWKDHWEAALRLARRGLMFISPHSHTPNLEWEFDRMNEVLRSEDIVYVIFDDSEDATLNYVRAYAHAQGSAVFSLG